MFYRGARRGDIAACGEAAADDLHKHMDDTWHEIWDAFMHPSRRNAMNEISSRGLQIRLFHDLVQRERSFR